MSNRKYTFVFIVLCSVALLLTGCGKKTKNNIEPKPIGENSVAVETPTPTGISDTPSSINAMECFLTGLPIEDSTLLNQRPIAVMIDNEASARPSSGIINADVVYEIPAEGNITRYMAIFHHLPTDKIGPVRSARPYFIDKALEYGAVYVHCGGSPQAYSDIKKMKVDELDELKGAACFWRSNDRKMPHNLYASFKRMKEVMISKKLENNQTIQASPCFKFSDSFENMGGKENKAISINYFGNYKVAYEYDEKEKVYYRIVNGSRMKDKESKQEVKTTNVIIERVKTKVLDKAGRLEVYDVGKDSGYFLTGGKLIEMEWEKKDRRAKTIYKDLKGNELELNKGNTWIQVVPYEVKIDIKE